MTKLQESHISDIILFVFMLFDVVPLLSKTKSLFLLFTFFITFRDN